MPYKDPEVRKAKHKEYSRKYYEWNKAEIMETSRINKNKARAAWQEYKKTLACESCGQNHPATLDFHHIVKDESNRKVNVLTTHGQYAAAREEIKKCMVLCANCHRIHHHEEREEVKKAKVVAKKKK